MYSHVGNCIDAIVVWRKGGVSIERSGSLKSEFDDTGGGAPVSSSFDVFRILVLKLLFDKEFLRE